MPAGPVVEGLDVGEDLGAELSPCRPGAAVDELLLQGGEERLGDGVIEAIALGAMERAMPASPAAWPKARDTNCEP